MHPPDLEVKTCLSKQQLRKLKLKAPDVDWTLSRTGYYEKRRISETRKETRGKYNKGNEPTGEDRVRIPESSIG